jgi:rSAM/selenodomain-associated transferase 2
MRISVLLPVLNEARQLPVRLEELEEQGFYASCHELIICDGGSQDGTWELVQASPHCQAIQAPRGRGQQINAAAAQATGDVLLILHADVRLPVDWVAQVQSALSKPGVVAGAFKTWHIGQGAFAPLFHVADLRSRVSGLPYGDQAFFLLRKTFVAAGGCPEQALFEDLELSKRVRALGEIYRVPACVQVSARRFEAAPFRYLVLMNTLPALYRAGVSLELIERLYGRVR